MKLTLKQKVAAIVGAVTIAAGTLPALVPPTNCGGQTVALSSVHSLAAALEVFRLKHLEGFDAEKHGWPDLNSQRFLDHIQPSSDSFLLGRRIGEASASNQIIAVCNLEFDNVPQPTIWNGYRRIPGHAALLADGTTKVITPAEFAALDLKQFVPLSSLKGFETKTAQAEPTRE